MFGENQYIKPPSMLKNIGNNYIHPTAIIEEGAVLGHNNYIGPFCFISSVVKMGNNNRFEGYCSIGMQAEHSSFKNKTPDKVLIGNNFWGREFITINAGTERPTSIYNNVIMLKGSHVGHDSIVNDSCTLSCNVLIGGHSKLLQGCNFGLGSVCHQYSIIGHYAIIGMNSTVIKKSVIHPFKKYAGSPVKAIGDNEIAIEKNNITKEEIETCKKVFDNLCNPE